MRKFLSPVINLVSLILVGIAYGLAGITAAKVVDKTSMGNYYQLVWQNPVALNIVGFFLIIVGTVALIVTFVPKCRKASGPLTVALLIAGGVLALLSPENVQKTVGGALPVYNQPGLIAMAVLLFVAAFFVAVETCLEFAPEEK